MAFFRCGGDAPKPFLFLSKNSINKTDGHPFGVYSPDGINVYTIRWWQDDRSLPNASKSIPNLGTLRYHTNANTIYFTLANPCKLKNCPGLAEGIYPAGVSFSWRLAGAPGNPGSAADTQNCADWNNCPSIEIRAV